MFVRDDGCGIDPQIAQKGSEGHWGIAGMHERAQAIGASFTVRSRAAAGTEVELSVPGDEASGDRPRTPLYPWLNRLVTGGAKSRQDDRQR